MPCPHNEITIVQRSQRQSAVAAAAYQSGEKLVVFTEQLFAALVSSGGNRRLPLAALNNRDFVVWTGHFVSLLSVIGGWGGVLPPHLGQKKSRRPFQISCSVCRCVGGGYLVVKVRDKLTRWVDGTLKNYGSLVISSLA